MPIKNHFINEIIKEFELVSKKIKEENNPELKIYFYSAAPGILNRVINLEYNQDLLFISYVLRNTYETIKQGIPPVLRGGSVVPLPDANMLLDRLADEINKLAGAISSGKDYNKILARIVEISYTVTGNGAYLHNKKIIKL